MKVLILHRLGNPKKRRQSVEALELLFPKNIPEANCIIHDINIPFPKEYKKINYDLIILGPTFLGARWYPLLLKKILKTYEFVKKSTAIKIALPQDEYSGSSILDWWLDFWNISVIYSVLDQKYETLLYPISSKKTRILGGFTGYLNKETIKKWSEPLCSNLRKFDIVYRASKLPNIYGKMGLLKSEIAKKFIEKIFSVDSSLKIDISTNDSDIIFGSKWLDFLENSRFCLATPSGSSIFDPINLVRNNKNSKVAPENKENQFDFSAISPRHIEASLTETIMIATAGNYSNLLNADEHYILLGEECENLETVVQKMKNKEYCAKLKSACKFKIINTNRLNESFIANEIASFVKNRSKNKISNFEKKVFDQHLRTVLTKETEFWAGLEKKEKFLQIIFKVLGNNNKPYFINLLKEIRFNHFLGR